MHGDRVVARLEHRRASGKLEGRVIRVLQRARRTFVGRLSRVEGEPVVTPLDRRLAFQVQATEYRRPAPAAGGAGAGIISSSAAR